MGANINASKQSGYSAGRQVEPAFIRNNYFKINNTKRYLDIYYICEKFRLNEYNRLYYDKSKT